MANASQRDRLIARIRGLRMLLWQTRDPLARSTIENELAVLQNWLIASP
jgi:hypothetical protein